MSTLPSTVTIDPAYVFQDMLGAAKGVLERKWPDVQAYAAKETRNLAETLLMIHKLRLDGEITEKQAELQLRIHRNTAVTVLTTIEGIGYCSRNHYKRRCEGLLLWSV